MIFALYLLLRSSKSKSSSARSYPS